MDGRYGSGILESRNLPKSTSKWLLVTKNNNACQSINNHKRYDCTWYWYIRIPSWKTTGNMVSNICFFCFCSFDDVFQPVEPWHFADEAGVTATCCEQVGIGWKRLESALCTLDVQRKNDSAIWRVVGVVQQKSERHLKVFSYTKWWWWWWFSSWIIGWFWSPPAKLLAINVASGARTALMDLTLQEGNGRSWLMLDVGQRMKWADTVILQGSFDYPFTGGSNTANVSSFCGIPFKSVLVRLVI